MKPIEGYDKMRGGYYTPQIISEFITQWAIRSKDDTVLEPSCGDGSFLGSTVDRLQKLGATKPEIKHNVMGIELVPTEADKAAIYETQIFCGDFFTYYANEIDEKKRYDVILGNPPFIRYQNFEEEYRRVAFSLMRKHGFSPNRLTNIWIPFLLLSCEALEPGGRIGMVIPAELFQVNYASEARNFLSNFFDCLNIITFKKLVFDDIQQEIVILLGEKKNHDRGIRFVELDDLQDLKNQWTACLSSSEIKPLLHSQDKWIKYYLTKEELDLLTRLDTDPRISNADELYEINVGLVSGENDFFVINQAAVDKFDLSSSVQPIISRSDQVKGIVLNDEDYDILVESGKKVYFFEPENGPFEELPSSIRKYITWGENQGYSKNYKCRIRPTWYRVSYTWRADAFLIRQANLYPKMILNQKKALVTDTLHKVRFANGVNGKAVVAAFLNTYTFALSETLGRSYGGGVLTFEPSEMRKMRIPMRYADELDFDQINIWQRGGEIEKILAHTDDVLLRRGLGLSDHEIDLLHGIWVKMRDRRLSRKADR
ncbi:MAG: SAM-dependent methyltransferase [Clostridiales bacterium]|nr:SAM-dependent methyltransferase [Clostridiales bacterium]